MRDEEDGLPTILEQSCAETGDQVESLELIKNKTQLHRGTIDLGKGYATNQNTPRHSDITGNQNLQALRMKYKHSRMQSKNALVNHYRSLSLMNGDDLTGILN